MKVAPFAGQRVVLTGGSSGIGRSLAILLARQGADLLLVARRLKALEDTLQELESCRRRGQTLEARSADVGRREQIEPLLTDYAARSPVDALINCAGVAYAEYLERTGPEVFEEMLRVNYLGTVWATRALVPHFRSRQKGHITNVASLAGVVGVVGHAAYAPSKFAVMGFSDVLRAELRRFGVRVSVLLPGDTDTPQLQEENRTKPAETRAISGLAPPMSSEAVAHSCLRGMAAGRYHIVPGARNWLGYAFLRHLPELARWFMDRQAAANRAVNGG
jgi:3-dehydrosphinganine reductase